MDTGVWNSNHLLSFVFGLKGKQNVTAVNQLLYTLNVFIVEKIKSVFQC